MITVTGLVAAPQLLGLLSLSSSGPLKLVMSFLNQSHMLTHEATLKAMI